MLVNAALFLKLKINSPNQVTLQSYKYVKYNLLLTNSVKCNMIGVNVNYLKPVCCTLLQCILLHISVNEPSDN